MILDEIVAQTREDVALRRRIVPLEELREKATVVTERRSLWHALDVDGVGVIAEIKRASPSGGSFVTEADAAAWAELYERNGAIAVSVLTNEPYFRGSPADLREARAACALPAGCRWAAFE
jgi:indole-3-glycerol phosphate synthase